MPSLRARAGRLEHRAYLHPGQLRDENTQAHATGTEHGVGLSKRLDPLEEAALDLNGVQRVVDLTHGAKLL